jgi:hypothetical protein
MSSKKNNNNDLFSNNDLNFLWSYVINFFKSWMWSSILIVIFTIIGLLKDLTKSSHRTSSITADLLLNLKQNPQEHSQIFLNHFLTKKAPVIVKDTSYYLELIVFSLIITIFRYFIFMRLMDKSDNSSKPLGMFKTILLCFLGFLFLIIVFGSGILKIIIELIIFIYLYKKYQKDL